MSVRHYGTSRYDLLESGHLTVKAKAQADKTDEVRELAVKFAEQVNGLSDQAFLEWNWWYEQNFHCKLGTTESMVECMLAESFLYGFWNGAYADSEKLQDVVIYIDVDSLEWNGFKYAVANRK